MSTLRSRTTLLGYTFDEPEPWAVSRARVEGDRYRAIASRLAVPIPAPLSCCWPVWEFGERAGPHPQYCCAGISRGVYCCEHAALAFVGRG